MESEEPIYPLSTRIELLEALIRSDKLIAPFKYINPERKKGIFYNFIQAYAEQQENMIIETTISFREELTGRLTHWHTGKNNYRHDTLAAITNIGEDLASLALLPLWPLFGGAHAIRCGDDKIIIYRPQFQGLLHPLMTDGLVHEYLHAYHKLTADRLFDMGAMECDAYAGLHTIEPLSFRKAPSHVQLWSWERKVLKAALAAERKGHLPRKRHYTVPTGYV